MRMEGGDKMKGQCSSIIFLVFFFFGAKQIGGESERLVRYGTVRWHHLNIWSHGLIDCRYDKARRDVAGTPRQGDLGLESMCSACVRACAQAGSGVEWSERSALRNIKMKGTSTSSNR